MLNELFLPISMVMGLLVFGFAAKWYLAPALVQVDLKTALTPLDQDQAPLAALGPLVFHSATASLGG